MNNLRDKLLKAGLVTSDAVKRVEKEVAKKERLNTISTNVENKSPDKTEHQQKPIETYEDTCKRARQFDEDLIKAERDSQ